MRPPSPRALTPPATLSFTLRLTLTLSPSPAQEGSHRARAPAPRRSALRSVGTSGAEATLADLIFKLTCRLLTCHVAAAVHIRTDGTLPPAEREGHARPEGSRHPVSLLHVLVHDHSDRAALLLQVLGSVCLLRVHGALSSEARNAEQRIMWQTTRDGLYIDVCQLWQAMSATWPCPAVAELQAWPQPSSVHLPNDPTPTLQLQALHNVREILTLWSTAQSDANDLQAIGMCISKLTETVRLHKTLCSGVLPILNKKWLEDVLPACAKFFPWLAGR